MGGSTTTAKQFENIGNFAEVEAEFLQELAWEWPTRKGREALLIMMLKAAPVHGTDKVQRVNRLRRARLLPATVKVNETPAARLTAMAASIALAESDSRSMLPRIAALCRATAAIDGDALEVQQATLSVVALVEEFAPLQQGTWNQSCYECRAAELLAIVFSASSQKQSRLRLEVGASRGEAAEESAASRGPAAVLEALLKKQAGATPLRWAAACCAISAIAVRSPETELSRELCKRCACLLVMLLNDEKLPELVPLVAASAIAELAESSANRPALLKAGFLGAAVGAWRRAAALGGGTAANATPTALMMPLHIGRAMCALCESATTRQAAVKEKATQAAWCLLVSRVDSKAPACRLGQEHALKFISLLSSDESCMSEQEEEDVLPSVVDFLFLAPELSVRRNAAHSLLAMLLRMDSNRPVFENLVDAAFLKGLEEMIGHNSLRGEILRILLVLVRSAAAATKLEAAGVLVTLEDLAYEKKLATAQRSLAIKIIFAMGHFTFFESGAATECASSDPTLREEARQLVDLVEDQACRLAFQTRPIIEQHFPKEQLLIFRDLFNDAARGGDSILGKHVFKLLRKCCVAINDKETRKKMTKGVVGRIVEIYDEDESGEIEWAEFLSIIRDLDEGRLTKRIDEEIIQKAREPEADPDRIIDAPVAWVRFKISGAKPT